MAKGKNGLKNIVIFIIALIIIIGIFVGGIYVGKKFPNIFNIEQTSQEDSNKIVIDEEKLEKAVKSAILDLAKEQHGVITTRNSAYAEGHKILKSEVKDNKIYAYVLTEYGRYYVNSDEEVTIEYGSSVPLTIKFEVNSNGEYVAIEKTEPESGANYYNTLKEMFPTDLLSEETKLHNGAYNEEFKKQISAYFKLDKNKIDEKKEEQNKIKETYTFEYEAENDNYIYILKSDKDLKEMEEVVLEVFNKNNSKKYTSTICKTQSEGAAGTIYITFDFELDAEIKGSAIIKVSNVAKNMKSLKIEQLSGKEDISTEYKELVRKYENEIENTNNIVDL